MKVEVEVIKETKNELPKYETEGSAGCDVRADLSLIDDDKFLFDSELYCDAKGDFKLEIKPGGRALIPTGLKVAIPWGYEIQIRPRSGLALKNGITVLNTPGTIDSDYRNEVKVILINYSNVPFVVEQGMRIGQFVLAEHKQIIWKEVEELSKTSREGGFCSTGLK